jgi:hypothetical protein
MEDVVRAKNGQKGTDWEFKKAEVNEVKRKGSDGPRYMVLAGYPFTRIRLDDLYTDHQWEIWSFASLVARREEMWTRYLNTGLLAAVQTLAKLDYWA